MPIPKPNKDEKEDKFISRCMSNDVMKGEFPKQDQRLAVCHQSWNDSKKDSKSEEKEEENA